MQLIKFMRTLPMILWLLVSFGLTLVGFLLALPTAISRRVTMFNIRMAMTSLYLQYLDANDYVTTGKFGDRLIKAFRKQRK